MNFFLSPIATFFSQNFYRSVSRQSIGKSFLYLLYLGVLLNFSLVIWLNVKGGPVLDRMVNQAIEKMPVMNMTEQGLSVDRSTPYTVSLLEVGGENILNLTFDTAKDRLTPEEIAELPDTALFVTKKAFYARQSGQGLRVIDFDAERKKNPDTFKPFTLDLKAQQGDINKAVKSIKGMGSLVILIAGIVLAFISGLVGALFYSLFGLLINLARKEKLPYAGVLNLAIYTLTPALLVACVLLPFHFTWFAAWAGGWINFLVTLGYLFFGVKVSEEKPLV